MRVDLVHVCTVGGCLMFAHVIAVMWLQPYVCLYMADLSRLMHVGGCCRSCCSAVELVNNTVRYWQTYLFVYFRHFFSLFSAWFFLFLSQLYLRWLVTRRYWHGVTVVSEHPDGSEKRVWTLVWCGSYPNFLDSRSAVSFIAMLYFHFCSASRLGWVQTVRKLDCFRSWYLLIED